MGWNHAEAEHDCLGSEKLLMKLAELLKTLVDLHGEGHKDVEVRMLTNPVDEDDYAVYRVVRDVVFDDGIIYIREEN